MTFTIQMLAALWLANPAPPPLQAAVYAPAASQSAQVPKEDDRFDRVADLISGQKPAEAIALLDLIIADQEKAHRGETRQVYCSRSLVETMLYSGMGAKAAKGAVVLGPDWSMAIFLKGFSLIDLNRSDEAKPLFEKAIAMSPMNAQFLGELGEWYKNRRDWSKAYDLFQRARAAAEYSPADMKDHDLRRGMRGMGFILIEQGKLDEAEALFRKCLEIDPNDAGAKQELQYIAEQRAKRPRTS